MTAACTPDVLGRRPGRAGAHSLLYSREEGFWRRRLAERRHSAGTLWGGHARATAHVACAGCGDGVKRVGGCSGDVDTHAGGVLFTVGARSYRWALSGWALNNTQRGRIEVYFTFGPRRPQSTVPARTPPGMFRKARQAGRQGKEGWTSTFPPRVRHTLCLHAPRFAFPAGFLRDFAVTCRAAAATAAAQSACGNFVLSPARHAPRHYRRLSLSPPPPA